MTSEQKQELTELTEIAVQNNDVESLIKIRKIIEQDIESSDFIEPDAFEWFECLLPAELFEPVFSN